MNIIDQILTYFQKPEKETRNSAPNGLCELCWGYQQYDRKIRDLMKDKQIDVNNHKSSYMLIERFVKDNLEGIKLKEGKIKDCPSCGCENPH